MPDDHAGSNNVSLSLPKDLIDAFDKLAAALDRPRPWVMVRALRCYLDEEGAEILEDSASLAELDRGESAPLEDTLRKVREMIERAEDERAQAK